MKGKEKMKQALAAAMVCAAMVASAYEYNVRMPSTAACPRWKGAKAGEWTMDYEAARKQAAAEGKCVLLFTTGSWWCPHCEAFEEKVLLDHAAQWRSYIQEKGYYLVMLDFPYRGHVEDSQLWKSKYPEYGDGWGFKCWLYDEDYLEENGLTKEEGLNAIMDLYRLQKSLALDSATPVSIKTWDGSEDFNYGKVGYPTLILFLPDGREAGRFSPGSTNRESDDAYNYVVDKIDSIERDALDQECGLCSDPEEWGLSGTKSETYRGWLSGDAGIVGTFEAKVGRKNKNRDIKISATATVAGKKRRFSGLGHDCCIDTVTLEENAGDAVMELMFDENGVRGSYVGGEDAFAVVGARDVFAARDAVAKTRRTLLVPGVWTFAMAVTDAPSDMACGYGAFSVNVAKSGSATVRGVLPDGRAVSTSGKVVIGDSDVYCLPISIDGNKGGLGCCLWFKNGWLFNVTDIRAWNTVGKNGFVANWRAICSSVPGLGDLGGDFELVLPEVPETIGGYPLVEDPNGDEITVLKNRLTGTEVSKFNATMNAKTGIISGTMKFFVEGRRGSVLKKSFKVTGAVVAGTVYCSAVHSGDCSIAVKVSACDACED